MRSRAGRAGVTRMIVYNVFPCTWFDVPVSPGRVMAVHLQNIDVESSSVHRTQDGATQSHISLKQISSIETIIYVTIYAYNT